MGWTFGNVSKKSLIANRVREQHSADGTKTWTCLAHCYRGNAYRGVLWTVWVITEDATRDVVTSYIGCDMLSYIKSETWPWGYKDLCESSGPNYYSCPLSYLDMVPDPESEHSTKWREKVREHHAKRNRKLTVGKVYAAVSGLRVRRGGVEIATIKVDSLRPIHGTAVFTNGEMCARVKFKKTQLLEEVK